MLIYHFRGHGPYSNQYGLGAEQVLEFQVVTPTGDIVTASETSHPDLFYALRGGGASTYGIVTRITYKAYQMPPATILALRIAPQNNTLESQDAFYNAMGYVFSMIPTLTDCGLSGYPVLQRSSYSGALMAPSKSVQCARGQRMLGPNGDQTEIFGRLGPQSYHIRPAQHHGVKHARRCSRCFQHGDRTIGIPIRHVIQTALSESPFGTRKSGKHHRSHKDNLGRSGYVSSNVPLHPRGKTSRSRVGYRIEPSMEES